MHARTHRRHLHFVLLHFFLFFRQCEKLRIAISLEGLFLVSCRLACLPVLTIIPVCHLIFIVIAYRVIIKNWFTIIYAWASGANLNDTVASIRLRIFENILLSVLLRCLLVFLRDRRFISLLFLNLCSVLVLVVDLGGRRNLRNHCVSWASSPGRHSLILSRQTVCLFKRSQSTELKALETWHLVPVCRCSGSDGAICLCSFSDGKTSLCLHPI